MKWTKEEEQFLTDNYSRGANYIAEHLNRPVGGVHKKAQALGISLGNRWLKEEEQFLIDNADRGSAYIAEQLSKSISSIHNKANKLKVNLTNITNYSKYEEQFLIDNAHRGSTYIAKQLNRSTNSVRNKANLLGVKLGNYKLWTEEEETTIKNFYSTTSSVDLSKKLNRSIDSILHKAAELELQKERSLDKKSTKGYLYLVFFPALNLYKVGITNIPKRRFREFGFEHEVLSLLEGSYSHIEELEKYLLKFIKPYLYNSGQLTSGNTETYKIDLDHTSKSSYISFKGDIHDKTRLD